MSAAGASAQSKESAQSRADLSSPLESVINIGTTVLWPFLFNPASLVCSVKCYLQYLLTIEGYSSTVVFSFV
jgi:hypothetical protein